MKKHWFILILIINLQLSVIAQIDLLRLRLKEIVAGKKAVTGFAILAIEDGDTLSWNAEMHFPMQSVYKFHLALAVLDKVQKGEISIEQGILIQKSDLLPGTWSPIRENYPEGDVILSLREILRYTVSESDNNGCDILFRLIGGPEKVTTFLAGTGINGISVKATEEEMHREWKVQFTNWCTPWSAIQLLEKFYRKEIVASPHFDLLWQQLIVTSTGPKRLKGLLPNEAIVAHKTGSSGTNEKGITAATNDIGIICLPNGKHIAIAVFVSDSTESNETNEGIIASIALETWNFFLSKEMDTLEKK